MAPTKEDDMATTRKTRTKKKQQPETRSVVPREFRQRYGAEGNC